MISVLHLTYTAGAGGGADTVILSTLARLDRAAFDVRAGYLRRRSQDISPIADRFAACGVPAAQFPGGRVFDVRQMRRLRAYLLRDRIRILHCHGPKADLTGVLVRRTVPGLRLVATLHGWIGNTRKGRFYTWLDRRALRGFDRVLAVSGSIRALAEEGGVPNVSCLHNGVDTEFWRPAPGGAGEEGRPFTVGFVGRLSPEKGPADFLRAAAGLARRRPGGEFLVVGRGPEEQDLQALACELGIAGSVRFLGHQEAEGLRSAYGRMDVLLLPSLTEGLPMVVLEALAMGVAVVATAVGGTGEILRDGSNGFLVEPGDVPAMVERIERLRDRPGLARECAARGREDVEGQFSAAKKVRELETVYRRLAGEHLETVGGRS